MAGPLQQCIKGVNSSATLVIDSGATPALAATTPGSRLVIFFASTTFGISSISGGGTWAADELTGQAHLSSGFWSCECTSSVTSITITYSGTEPTGVAVFSEWPMVSHAPVGAVLNSAGGNSTAPACGPITPLDAEHLTLFGVAHRGTYSSGPTGGFTGGLEAKIGTVAARYGYLEGHNKTALTGGYTLSAVVFWDTAMVQYERPPAEGQFQTDELTDQIAVA